jgi:phosphoserine phosphatase RsbU/P
MWILQPEREWIDSVCRQLSRVTGWPTTFAPAAEPTLEVPGEYQWSCELQSHWGRVGTLNVLLPLDRELDDSFLRACETADLATQLIRRVLIAQAVRDELPPTISSGGRPAEGWEEAVHRVLDVALRLADMRAAVLFVLDRDSGQLRLRGQLCRDRMLLFGRPLDQSPFDAAAIQSTPVVIRRREEQFSEWLPEGMALGVCRGIQSSQGLQGTLWMFDRRDRRLTSREEAVLESISVRMAELIEHARQVEAGAQQRRLQAELRIAAESQPRHQFRLQGAGGWCHIAARSECAREVGGDLCEVIPLGRERYLLAIGDAAGHSIPAAMVMSAVRGALRVIADPREPGRIEPHRIVSRLNQVLHGIVESHQFMTLVCAILDGSTSTLELCNAGHPPALLIRQGSSAALEAHGLLLGVVDDARYQTQTFHLEPGDLLAFYSDGVSEARARSQQLFRAQSIASIMTRHAELPPEQLVESVWTALHEHVSAAHPDDRTLLVVRFDGRPALHSQTESLPAVAAGV